MANANAAIPGLDYLGKGFNPFDPYASDLAQSAFRPNLITWKGVNDTDFMTDTATYEDNDQGGVWTVPEGSASNNDPLSGTSYQVPADVEVEGKFDTSQADKTFYSYQQIAKYFSSQAGVSGGEGLFSGSAEARFSSSTYQSSANFYGLHDMLAQRWALTIDDALLYTPELAEGSFWENSFMGVSKVPKTFDPTDSSSVGAFKQWFSDFGSHVVNGVIVGYRGLLSVSIERSSNITTSNASTDIKVEYENLTSSLGTNWAYKDKNYISSRNSSFLLLGGDQTLAEYAVNQPNQLAPGPDKITNYENWLKSTDQNPSLIQVQLIGMWQLGIFDSSQQQALQQAYEYFTVPTMGLPFYLYQGKNQGDYLYTTLENPEGSDSGESGIHFNDYNYKGIPFYVLPQDSDYEAAQTLYRYYNGHVHFYTTDPLTDTEIISDGKYHQDENYSSKVLPLGTSAAQPEYLATVYRWELTDSDGHWLGTDPNDAPPNQKASEGAKFTALAYPPQDPFSTSTDSAPRKLTGEPPAGDAVRPGAPAESIPVIYIGDADVFLQGLAYTGHLDVSTAIQAFINTFVVTEPDFTQRANLYPSPTQTKSIPIPPNTGAGYASSCNAYCPSWTSHRSGLFGRKIYKATQIYVVSFSG